MSEPRPIAPWFHGHAFAAEPVHLRSILAAHPDANEAARLRAGMFDDEHGEWPHRMPRYTVSADGVATVHVTGLLVPRDEGLASWVGGTTYASIAHNIDAAADDTRVRRLRLYADSPGGFVAGIDDAVAAILRARQKKPVDGYVAGLCCSGCYWLLAQCDQIAAAPSAIIGCLGVVQTWLDPTRAMESFGVDKFEFVSSQTPRKRPDPREDDGKAQIQRQVDDLADVFLRAVAEGRGVPLDTVLADFGQGDSYVAARALAAGMIDEVRARPEVGARRTAPSVQTGPALAAADNHESPASSRMEDAMSVPGQAPDASAEARVKAAETERDKLRAQAEASENEAATLRADLEAKEKEAGELRAKLRTAEQKAAAAEDAVKAATSELGSLKTRLDAIERANYEARRDGVIEATVARGAIEKPQRADWVARYDRMAAAGMEDDARALLEGLPSGRAVPQGAAGRPGTPEDLDRGAPQSRSDLDSEARRMVAEARAAGRSLSYTDAFNQLAGQHPQAALREVQA